MIVTTTNKQTKKRKKKQLVCSNCTVSVVSGSSPSLFLEQFYFSLEWNEIAKNCKDFC